MMLALLSVVVAIVGVLQPVMEYTYSQWVTYGSFPLEFGANSLRVSKSDAALAEYILGISGVGISFSVAWCHKHSFWRSRCALFRCTERLCWMWCAICCMAGGILLVLAPLSLLMKGARVIDLPYNPSLVWNQKPATGAVLLWVAGSLALVSSACYLYCCFVFVNSKLVYGEPPCASAKSGLELDRAMAYAPGGMTVPPTPFTESSVSISAKASHNCAVVMLGMRNEVTPSLSSLERSVPLSEL